MKKAFWCGLFLLMSGCIPSLHALWTPDDLIYSPALLGVWYADDGQSSFAFARSDSDKEYKLLYTDKDGKTGNFVAHLLKLRDTMFLDLYPDSDNSSLTESEFYRGHLIAAHSFMRVDQIGPKLVICDMNYDWTEKYLADNPTAVAHETIGHDSDKQLVLTASTADLQKFVLARVNDDGFFVPAAFTRDKPATRP